MRLNAKAQDWDGARALCLQAKENPESEAELQCVRRALPRIHRQLEISIETEPKPAIPEFETVLEGMPSATRADAVTPVGVPFLHAFPI
jgi:hypothetical protein